MHIARNIRYCVATAWQCAHATTHATTSCSCRTSLPAQLAKWTASSNCCSSQPWRAIVSAQAADECFWAPRTCSSRSLQHHSISPAAGQWAAMAGPRSAFHLNHTHSHCMGPPHICMQVAIQSFMHSLPPHSLCQVDASSVHLTAPLTELVDPPRMEGST